MNVYSVFVRCQRWRLLLRPVGDVRLLPLFSATAIGFFCNMILPLRVGEVVRPVLLARRTTIPVSSVFASVVLERLLDMLTILVFLGLVMTLVPVSDAVRRSGAVFLVLAIVTVSAVVALQRRQRFAIGAAEWLVRRFPDPIRERAAACAAQLHRRSAGHRRRLRRCSASSATRFSYGASSRSIFALGFIACDLPVPLVTGGLALVTIVAGAVSAPSAPGFIGTFQAGAVLALGLFGIDRADAVPYSFVVWAAQWLGQILLGVVFLLRENISFREVASVEESAT